MKSSVNGGSFLKSIGIVYFIALVSSVSIANTVTTLPEGHTPCAMDGAVCSAQGSWSGYYGAAASFVAISGNGAFTCLPGNLNVADPKPNVAKTCYLKNGFVSKNAPITSVPAGFKACAVDGKTCEVPWIWKGYYGANSTFVPISGKGSFVCLPSTFKIGDPVANVVKTCYIQEVVKPTDEVQIARMELEVYQEGNYCSGTPFVNYMLEKKYVAGRDTSLACEKYLADLKTNETLRTPWIPEDLCSSVAFKKWVEDRKPAKNDRSTWCKYYKSYSGGTMFDKASGKHDAWVAQNDVKYEKAKTLCETLDKSRLDAYNAAVAQAQGNLNSCLYRCQQDFGEGNKEFAKLRRWKANPNLRVQELEACNRPCNSQFESEKPTASVADWLKKNMNTNTEYPCFVQWN